MTNRLNGSNVDYDEASNLVNNGGPTPTSGTVYEYAVRQFEAHISWSTTKDSIYRAGQLLATVMPDNTIRHYHLDHLGTPSLITGPTGAMLAHHTYFPFGEEIPGSTADAERMKFTGHERDLNNAGGTGDDLDYMHARYCSPVTGRFLSVDPVLQSEQALQTPQL